MSKELGKIDKILIGYHDYNYRGEPAILTSFSMGLRGNVDWRQPLSDLKGLLEDAKVFTADQLQNKPVEITLDGNAMISWRILTEVL